MSLKRLSWSLSADSATITSLFNVGRSLINPLFIATASYLFIWKQLSTELEQINKINAFVNLLLVFSGWGLRDFLIKESVKLHSEFSHTWHLALYSKILLLFPLMAACAIWQNNGLVLPIAMVLALRTLNTLYEPLIVSNKKGHLFFSVDFGVSALLLLLITVGFIKKAGYFFYFLMVFEFLKLFICVLVFRAPVSFRFKCRELFSFLKSTRFYFLLVLVSFFQSKVDLYLLGFLLKPMDLNEYQLLSSLLSLVLIMITSFVVSYSKLFYRNIHDSEKAFRKIILRCGYLVAATSSLFIYFTVNFIYHFNYGFMNVIIVAINVISFTYVLFEMYYHTKKEWLNKVLLFVFLAGCTNLIFSFMLIRPFGVTGALGGNTAGLLLLAYMMARQRINGLRNKNI